jgi:hypothetical protein
MLALSFDMERGERGHCEKARRAPMRCAHARLCSVCVHAVLRVGRARRELCGMTLVFPAQV